MENVVQIVLQAQDKASVLLKSGADMVSKIGEQAIIAQKSVAAMGGAMVGLGGAPLAVLKEVYGTVNIIRTTLNTPVGKQLVSSMKEAGDEAFAQSARLSTIFSSIGKVATPAIEGAVLGDNKAKIEAKARLAAEKLGAAMSAGLSKETGKLSEQLSNQLEPFFSKAEKDFGAIGKMAADFGRGSLATGTFVDKFGNEVKQGLLVSKIDEGLSSALDFGFKNFLKTKLPLGLNLFSDQIYDTAKNLSLLPDEKSLLKGSFGEGISAVIKNRVGDAFVDAFQKIDAAADASKGNAEKAGEILANSLINSMTGQEGGFKKVIKSLLPENEIGEAIRAGISGPFKKEFDSVTKLLDDGLKKGLSFGFKLATSGGGEGIFKDIKTKFLQGLADLDKSSDGLITDIGISTGARLGASFGKGFAGKLLPSVMPALEALDDRIQQTVGFISNIPGKLEAPIGAVGGIFKNIAGFGEPLAIFGGLQEIVGGVTEKLGNATAQFGLFTQGFQQIQSLVVGGPFELLIGQTIKLREQLLATQATLAGTNNIMVNGAKADPSQAIQALEGPINRAIADLRQGSLELVGVTSKDLVEAFQIVAGQAGAIGYSLKDSTDLTLSFAATLGTLGVPLFQARQEINSILTGQIDMNSVVAKSLGLTNNMVNSWKSQGVLVERLNERMAAFKEGNKLASMSMSGITSNIQEIFDMIGQKAGEPLLDPILQQLNQFYEYLNKNKDGLTASVGGIVKALGDAVFSTGGLIDALKKAYSALEPILTQIPGFLTGAIVNVIKEFAGAISTTIDIIKPALGVFAALAQQAVTLGGPFLKIFLQFKVLQTAIQGLSHSFGILTQVLPGVGELLFILQGRNSGLINTFANLTSVVGQGGAGFLMLGKHLNSIPGAAGMVAAKLGPLGPMIAGLIPGAAGLGITLIGLSQKFPALGTVMQNLGGQVPGLVNGLANLAGNSKIAGGAFAAFAPGLQKAASEMANYTNGVDLATLLNQKFAEQAKQAGLMMRQQVVSFGLLAGGAFAAFYVFDNFVLKNENLQRSLKKLEEALKKIGAEIAKVIAPVANVIATVLSALANALANPVTLAIAGVTALGFAFKSGLLDPLLNVNKAVGEFMKKIAAMPGEKFQQFTELAGGILKKGTPDKTADNQAAALKNSAEDYKTAIAERQAKIAEIDGQLAKGGMSPTAKRALQAEKEAIQSETDQIKQFRQQQGRELARLKKEAAIQRREALALLGDDLQAPADQIGALSPKPAPKNKKEAAQQKGDDLRGSATDYKQGLKDRRSQISNIEAQLASGDPFVNRRELEKEKQRLEKESKEIREARRKQGEELAKLKQEASLESKPNPKTAATPVAPSFAPTVSAAQLSDISSYTPRDPQKSVTQKVAGAAKTVGSKVAGTGAQLGGIISNIGGEALAKFGAAAKNSGLEGLSKNLETASGKMQDFGSKTLASATAQNGMLNNAKAASTSMGSITTALGGAAKGAMAFGASMAAALGPMAALTAATMLITEIVSSYSKIEEASHAQTDETNRLFKEQREQLEQILKLRGDINNLPPPKGGKDRRGQREEEVGQERDKNFWGNIFANTGDALLNFTGQGQLAKQGFKRLTGKDSIRDLQVKGQVEAEEKDFNTNTEAIVNEAAIAETSGMRTQIQLEQELANLQKARSEAAAKGNAEEVKAIDKKLESTKEAIAKNVEGIDLMIKQAESSRAVTDQQAEAKDALIKRLKELKETMQSVADTKIVPVDLPRLGTAFEQLQATATNAENAIKAGTGNTEEVNAKAKGLIDTTQQQLEQGQITGEEARRRASLIVGNEDMTAENQIAAQKLITAAYESENAKQTQAVETRQAEIDTLVAQGVITEAEGAARVTEAKLVQLNAQLDNLREAKRKELEIEQAATKAALEAIDTKIAEAKLRVAAASGDQAARDTLIDQEVAALNTQKEGKTTEQTATQGQIDAIRETAKTQGRELTAEEATKIQELERIIEQLKADIGSIDGQITAKQGEKGKPVQRDDKALGAANSELTRLEQERQGIVAASNTKVENINAGFRQREAQTEAQIAQEKRKEYDNKHKDKLEKAAQAETKAIYDIEEKRRKGQITYDQAEEQKLAATSKRIATEISLEEERLKAAEKRGDKTAVAESQKRLMELRKQQKDQEEAVYKQKADKLVRAETGAHYQIEKLREAGKISNEQAHQQKLAATKQRIAEELKLEEERLAKAEKEGNSEQVAKSQQKIMALKKQQADAEIAEINRVAKKAMDAARAASAERENQAKRMKLAGGNKEDIAMMEARNAKESAQEELKIERDKLRELQRASGDNEEAIRESKTRVLELTGSVLDAELQMQEAHINKLKAVIQKKSQQEVNAINRSVQGLEEQTRAYDMLTKSLDTYNNLLSISKELGSLESSSLTQEIDILAKGEKSERKRKELAEAAAAVKLQSAKEQFELEKQMLEMDIQKNKIALERRDIENQIAILKKQAEVVQGEAELKKAKLDLKTGAITKEEFESMAIEQTGKRLELAALGKERELIGQEKAMQPLLERAQRGKLELEGRGRVRQAEAEFAESGRTPAEKRRRYKAMGDEFAQEQGFTGRGDLIGQLGGKTKQAVDEVFRGGKPGALKDLSAGVIMRDVGDIQRSLEGAVPRGGVQIPAATAMQPAPKPKPAKREYEIVLDRGGKPFRRLKPLDRDPGADIPAGPGRVALPEIARERLSAQRQAPAVPTGIGVMPMATAPMSPRFEKAMEQLASPTGRDKGQQTITISPNITVTITSNAKDNKGSAAELKQLVLQQLGDAVRKAEGIAAASFK